MNKIKEIGFYDPEKNVYWQAINEVPDDIRSKYPKGTIEVPLKPKGDYNWENGEWVKDHEATLAAKAAQARYKRDKLLAECDWTQQPDAPVDQSAWKQYRQDLRDVSKQPKFPFKIIWPEKPS